MNGRRSTFLLAAMTLSVIALLPANAAAQDFEITPFGGYRFGGDFFELMSQQRLDLDGAPAFGVAVDVPTSPGAQFEAFYTRQHAHVPVPTHPFGPTTNWPMTVEHYQAGGAYEFHPGTLRPFMTGSLGLTHYGTTGDNEVRFGLAFGGGVKVLPPAGNIGLRLETRVFTTFVDADAGAFACSGPTGTCFIAFNANVLWQMEFTAGVVIRFR